MKKSDEQTIEKADTDELLRLIFRELRALRANMQPIFEVAITKHNEIGKNTLEYMRQFGRQV